MILGILLTKKFDDTNENYQEYREFEIESYRWSNNHLFEYIPKKATRWYKLEDNEELAKML